MKLRCEMAIGKSLARDEPAALTFALTNSGSQALQILNWQTPFEGVRAPMFTVLRDGSEVEYRGIMIKRGAPRGEDYLSFAPGERRAVTLDLNEGWDLAPPGNYTVEYSGQLFDVITGNATAPRQPDKLEPMTPTCTPVTFVRQR